MTGPTGPDPHQPHGTPLPPQQNWNAPPPGYGTPPVGQATGQRPGQVTAAAVIGIVWGALGSLFGLLGLIGASVIAESDLGVEITALDIVVTILGIAVAVALIVGGIQVLRGKSPQLLFYAALALAAAFVLGVIVNLAQGRDFAVPGVLTIVVAAVIVSLLRNERSKQYYASQGISY